MDSRFYLPHRESVGRIMCAHTKAHIKLPPTPGAHFTLRMKTLKEGGREGEGEGGEVDWTHVSVSHTHTYTELQRGGG